MLPAIERRSGRSIRLGDLVVLDHGDALLADVDGDQQLTLRGRQRRPSRRCTPPRCALLARSGTPVGTRRLLLGGLGLDLGLVLLGFGRAGLGRVGPALGAGARALSSAAASTAASALAGCALGCARLGGRLAYCVVGGRGNRRALSGSALVGGRLAPSKPSKQLETPSGKARALRSSVSGRSARCRVEEKLTPTG